MESLQRNILLNQATNKTVLSRTISMQFHLKINSIACSIVTTSISFCYYIFPWVGESIITSYRIKKL